MEKSIIVAVAEGNAIGRKNELLWHLAEDLKYFKEQTSGYPVIMGFMTFKSIGRPLPKRTNIVISIFPWPDAPEGIVIVDSLEAAYKAAEATGAQKCFVMGGAYTYAEAMQSADTLYITHVHASAPDADAFFPEISPEVWTPVWKSELRHDAENDIDFQFVRYARR